MINFCPLASGSKGNAVFLATAKTKILIDAGISLRAITTKLDTIGVRIEELDAIIISHEHHDHIAGLKALFSQREIPIISNLETAKAICASFCDEQPKFKIFTTGEIFEFQDLEIEPFSVKHDAVDPVGFRIKTDSGTIGLCTDCGQVTGQITQKMSNCNLLYVEANHEPELVMASKRPPFYKERVLGPLGHLSNQATASLIQSVYHPKLHHVILAHLSQECNRPELAMNAVKSMFQGKEAPFALSCASQNQISVSISF